ncbi:MAG: ATP-binding protein, partial [Aureliella sp.]
MVTSNSTALADRPSQAPSAASRFRINGIVGLLIAFFILAIVAVQWQRKWLMDKLIESSAIQAAKIQVDALAAVRAVYSEDVVDVVSQHGIDVTHDYSKNDHSIPLPATLTFLIADRIGKADGGGRTRLYSPYPFKWREAEGGLQDDFQKKAWEKLNADPDTPVYDIVNTADGRGLRYAVADRMQASCIQCHNEHPDTPRNGWKVGDVRGVLEIELPLANIEARARQNLFTSSLLMGLLAFIGGALILATVMRFNRVTAERDQFVRRLHAANATLDQMVNERTAKLRAVEERFELAVRGSTDGLWDWNVLTSEVFYSPRFKELVGYSDDEFPDVLESFESRLHPNDHDRIMDALKEHLKSRVPYDVQYRLLTKSRDYRWFRARGQAIWNDVGAALRMAGSITDMTEEHRLRERFRLAVEASPVALMMVHRDGRILMCNSRCLSLFGYTEAELVGQPTEMLVPSRLRARHPARRENVFSAQQQANLSMDIELPGARKDGTEIPVRVGLSHVETAEGPAVICGIIDITDQKQTLAAMRQAKEAAESASLAKSSFLANMSHEIRTPMNGIIGMSQLLAQTELRSNQREYLQTVDESAHVLLRLLNDILDFSKIEAGKLELEHVAFRLSECVARASQMITLRAAEKGLEVACRVAPEIPDHLMGDPGRLQQVLVNLLGNAIKFTETGEVFVNVTAESISAETARLEFSVSDTGIGIAPDKIEQVFRPFEQAESSTTRRFGGTGLGLTISSQLVEMMHGRMWLESEVGKGSIFRFTAEFDVSATQHAHPPAALRSLQDLSVLIVDDNSTNRRILNELLQYWHMRPISVESAAAARTAITSAAELHHPVQLILLDHHMPGED